MNLLKIRLISFLFFSTGYLPGQDSTITWTEVTLAYPLPAGTRMFEGRRSNLIL